MLPVHKNKNNSGGDAFAGGSSPTSPAFSLGARYRRWLEAGPGYVRGDLERLRAFQPRLKPVAVYTHLAVVEMGA